MKKIIAIAAFLLVATAGADCFAKSQFMLRNPDKFPHYKVADNFRENYCKPKEIKDKECCEILNKTEKGKELKKKRDRKYIEKQEQKAKAAFSK